MKPASRQVADFLSNNPPGVAGISAGEPRAAYCRRFAFGSRLLLIRLFQHATICSVYVCRARHWKNLHRFQRQFATESEIVS